MTSINVTVCEAQAQAVKNGKLTTHMVGVPVSFSFDAAWDGLHKFAVFRCGKVTRDRSLILSDTTTVPHEVLHKAEEHLFVGVEGRAPDGTLVIPTTWADAGVVLDGANACGVRGKDPTPDAYDDIMEAIQSGILRGPKGDKGDPGASYIRDIGAGRLNEAEKAALATVDGEGFLTDPIFMESNNLDGFSRWVYRQIGVDVGAYMKSVHKTYTSMFNARLLTVEEGADPYCLAMLVDGSYSGKTKWMQNNKYEYKLELKDYKIGDIFCMRYNDTLEGLSGTRTSCYYMALYQAENTFILYQDFGAEEEKLYPSNVKVIDYAALLDIINTTENQYYYVLRPENIALMPVTILSDLNNAEAFCVGALPVSRGGTGGTTPQSARTNLGITPTNIGAAPASHNHSASNINTGILATNRLPTVPISKGGTGSTTAEGARKNIGALPDTLVTSGKVFASTSSDSLQKYIDNVLSTMESETNKIVFVDNDSQDPALFGLKFGGARWNLLIAKFSDNYASVFGWGANTCVYSYKKKTVWSEWMYSSPSTSVGTAFPILERWDGKPVYTKIVNCGGSTNGKTISHGIPAGRKIIRYAGVLGIMPLPINDSGTIGKAYVSVDTSKITITVKTNAYIGHTVYVQLWYV